MPRIHRTAMLFAAVCQLGPQAASAETIEITMQNVGFSPAEVKARVGDTIAWINKDILSHTATARNGDFDVNIAASKTATLVLKKTGDVEYYCRFHPNMKGRITIARE